MASFIILILLSSQYFAAFAYNPPDSLRYISIKALVISAEDNSPLVFASVYLEPGNIGTVTNSEGIFLLKIPYHYSESNIVIKSLGFKKRMLSINELSEETNIIRMDPALIPIEEVTISLLDPKAILADAIKSIADNYSRTAVEMNGFYRESIRKNNKYLSVGEAVIDIYKASYTKITDSDRIRILKGRKAQNIKNSDTLIMKFQGGPLLLSELDLIKHPGIILTESEFLHYNYVLEGMVEIGEQHCYKIGFAPKNDEEGYLYCGNIYIDVESSAIVNIELEVCQGHKEEAVSWFIKKKPFGLKMYLLNAKYIVSYRIMDDKWYIHYIRTELSFKSRWKKKLFSSNFYITSETAVTGIDKSAVSKPKAKEAFSYHDVFSEQVSDFSDPDFWGVSNVIEPERSIQEAISKISRKLNRKQKSLFK